MEWIPFDVLEFVEHKPRVVVRRFFEINPLGEVRYLRNIKRPQWKIVKPVAMSGKRWFVVPIGHSGGNIVMARIRIDDLVKRFFPYRFVAG